MKKEQWVGLLVVVVLIGGLWWWRAKRVERAEVLPAEGQGVEIEDRASELAKRFGVILPDNLEQAELKDVTGGVSGGIATRSYADGKFELTVLAELPEPGVQKWYEGWLVRNEPFSSLYAGKLSVAKGGFLLEFSDDMDWRDHAKVVVTLEKKDDRQPETHVLEGEFK
jgi:hypothetical protein